MTICLSYTATSNVRTRVRTNLQCRVRSALSLAFAVAASACVNASQQAARGTGAAGASRSSDINRDARLLRMTDLRQFDTTLVDEMLKDSNSERRARAALAIGQVKGRARYAELRKLLVDADTAVAANAAFALGIGKDTSAIVALARAVAGAPDAVAMAAAWSLGDIGEPAKAVLSVALGEGIGQPLVFSTAAQRSPAVRAALIIATSKLRPTPVSVLLPWLADRDPTVVRAVAYTVARTRSSGAVRAMIALRGSNDEETRQHVARLLTRQQAGDSLSGRAFEALEALMADSSALVRVNAVRSLATFGAQAKAAVLKAMSDKDGNVRVAATEVAVPYLGTDASAWKHAYDADATLPVRITLIGAARRAAVTSLLVVEDSWQHSTDWRARAALLRARIDSAHPPKVADVAWGLLDNDARVRVAAVTATRFVARAEPRMADSVRKLWVQLLNDPDVQTRATVISALRQGATTAELPSFVAVYNASLNDRDNAARVAALTVIASVWHRDSTRVAPELRQRIASFRVPSDSAELSIGKSISLLPAWNVAKPANTQKSIGEYEAIVRRYGAIDAKPVTAVMRTERGNIVIALYGHDAPLTVDNFVQLARRGFYNNTQFHRVVPNFVAQDGDPRGDGTGNPGYTIRDELTRDFHDRGSLAMATSGPDTAGSQYYLCHSPQPHLDGHYVVFGQMTQGYDVLNQIVQGDRILSVEIR
jgi:cyclophilin family peptidyl-prolyl cis-trans isomerase/HEAT repeat protein